MNKDEALNKFTFMMEYRNLSSNTVHMYRWYLSRMFDFYQLEDVSILDVSMAQNYVVHMKQTYAPASLNAVISAIRYFSMLYWKLRYLEDSFPTFYIIL